MDGFRDFTLDQAQYSAPKMQQFLRQLRQAGRHWVPIVDPGIMIDPGYPAYDAGLAADVFLKGVDGKSYVGQVCCDASCHMCVGQYDAESDVLAVVALGQLAPSCRAFCPLTADQFSAVDQQDVPKLRKCCRCGRAPSTSLTFRTRIRRRIGASSCRISTIWRRGAACG